MIGCEVGSAGVEPVAVGSDFGARPRRVGGWLAPPPTFSRKTSQPGDGSRFVPANSLRLLELHRTPLRWDAILAWPCSSRLSVEPIAPAATPAWAWGSWRRGP